MKICLTIGLMALALVAFGAPSALAYPPQCGSSKPDFEFWKKNMQSWLEAGNKGEYYQSVCGGRSAMGPRMSKEFSIPMEIDWSSFKRAFDKADAKTKSKITRLNLATYCGFFWSGLSHYGSGNSGDPKDRAKIKKGVKKGVCFYSSSKNSVYKLVTKGKQRGSFRIGINSRSYNIDRFVADELKKKLKLRH